MGTEERDLILSPDKRYFVRFYRAHAGSVRSYVRAKVENRLDAEEIVQDVFFSFLESLRDFQGKSSLKTYLHAIARHKVVDYYRRKKLKTIVFSQAPNIEPIASTLLCPDELLDEKLLRERIRQTLSILLPRYRQILEWKYDEDMTVDSIAKKLAISFKSAEARLFRARKAFVEVFSRH